MGEHTPWKLDEVEGILFDARGEMIADFAIPQFVSDHIRMSRGEQIDNARICAAAPALLEAAKLWLAYDQGDQEDGVQLMLDYADALAATKAAISQATGQSK